MNEAYTYIAPFIAAFVASFTTYFFAVRAKKNEVLTTYRIAAFKAVQLQINDFRRYYNAMLSEIQLSEFESKPDDLPEKINISPLEQRTLLDLVLAENAIFLSPKTRSKFKLLDNAMVQLCNANLFVATNEIIDENRRLELPYIELENLYSGILDNIEDCTNAMYKDLKLPN